MTALGAQTPATPPLNPPAPLAPPPPVISPATLAVTVAAAERAHDLGFLTVATNLYRELLAAPGVDKAAITLALAGVLLDANQPAEAEQVLATLPEPRSAAWRLRAGLAAFQLRKRDVAQAQWDSIKVEELPEPDRPWYHFFTGALYDTGPQRNQSRANDFYILAERSAPTDLARARFQLAAERVRLQQSDRPSPETLRSTKQLYDQNQGRESSYEPARLYAVMLALDRRPGEAVDFLRQNVLLSMPAQERAWRDEFQFLVGVLGDRSRNGLGRNALVQLVTSGTKVERQRQALQLLADASKDEPERGHFRGELLRLMNATPPHPLLESLLYFRAQLALGEKDYAAAEDAARRLLRGYPTSSMRLHAHGVLTQSAWEQQRYRTAASSARDAQGALPPPPATGADPFAATRTDLGVLEAEAWFRLGEYRDAASAYAGVLRDRPPGLSPERLSGLIFQRILAEIHAESPNAAAIVDEAATDPAFRVDDRWQAEWSLARSWHLRGKVEEAYARIGRLLGGSERAGLRPELHARMAWLRAKLAFDSRRYEQALTHIDELVKSPGEIEPNLRDEIISTAVLLQAQAELQLNREPIALATLKRLRDQFPDTDAAVHSYLIESDYYARQEKISEAQQRLTALTDNPRYAKRDSIPYAYFQLALLSERLGQDKDLEDANRRLEQLVKSLESAANEAKTAEAAANEAELMFAARLKQGDIFRKRSDFTSAQRAYEYLVNNYARRPDVVLAQLALADCHSARSASDKTQAESARAQAIYEELRDRVDAPADVRVEAGYKLGFLLVLRDQSARAANVWWKDVVEPFLNKNKDGFAPGDKRPYWLARTLLDYGKLHEEQGKLEEARMAYRLLLDAKLGSGESLAREALKRLGLSLIPAKP